MSTFNHFRVKRQAHALSRKESAWNPFGHTWNRSGRRGTWSGGSIESEAIDQDSGSPIQQGTTAPARLGDEGVITNSHEPVRTAEDSGNRTAADGHTYSEEPDGLRVRKTLTIEEAGESTQPKTREKEHRLYKKVYPKEPFTVVNQLQRTLLDAWINVLLLCVPAGYALYFTRGKSGETFAVNILAAVPLLFLNDFAMEEIGLRTGPSLGNLIYNSCSNIVLLITCVLLITSGQGHLVQFTLAGSILTNILLVLGIGIICGSSRRTEQYFNKQVAHVSANMLSLSATSLLIPTASNLLQQASSENLIKQSRGASFLLMLVFILYLFFQNFTHLEVFEEECPKVPIKISSKSKSTKSMIKELSVKQGIVTGPTDLAAAHTSSDPNALRNLVIAYREDKMDDSNDDDDDDGHVDPKLHFTVAVFVFISMTVILYFCIDFAVASIDALTTEAGISPTFVGLILLPLPNCDFTPILAAVEDKLDITMTCTIGKCLGTALLITPLSVLVAWAMGDTRVTLVFEGFEVVSLFAAILLLNLLVSDGKVRWIQGTLLLADWGLIAIAAFYSTR